MGRITAMVLALGIALAGLTALAAAQDTEDVAAPETIAWRTDLAAARVEARESQRPLMVVFR